MHVSSHIVFNTHLQCSAELTVLVMVWLQCVNIFVKFSLILFWHSFNQLYIKKKTQTNNFDSVALTIQLLKLMSTIKKLKTCISGFFRQPMTSAVLETADWTSGYKCMAMHEIHVLNFDGTHMGKNPHSVKAHSRYLVFIIDDFFFSPSGCN